MAPWAAACGGPADASSAGWRAAGGDGVPSLLVLAASDLALAFDELADTFRARSGIALTPIFGSSGNLAAQISAGAPADLFFAADESFIDRLIGEGAVDATSRVVYAYGRLALVAPAGRKVPDGVRALADPRYAVVAIANPDHAPYGRAAREALEAAGVLGEVEPRLVFADNVRHALQFATSGNVDVAMVSVGLLPPGARGPHTVVPEAWHAPLRQVAGVVQGSARGPEARAFLDFVVSAAGQEILVRYGFEPGDRP